MSPGNLILSFIDQLETAGVPCVYLRNHESLPNDVGNDVDLLIQQGFTPKALAIITAESPKHGWKVLYTVQFSPLSVFLATDDGATFLHIDLFERLEWHCIEYANAQKVLERRQWNGPVPIPDPADELYLNICTRLIYQGKVREKHRAQVQNLVDQGLQSMIHASFTHHLGSNFGKRLADAVIYGDWHQIESSATALRRAAIMRYALFKPLAAVKGLGYYLSRSVKRILCPPGPFVIFEGADGVGKSTVIEGTLPFFKEITGRSDTLLFHWKPNKASMRLAGQSAGAPCDPRGKCLRSAPLSLLFLAYHWLGFWLGYLRYVLPASIKNRAVIGDRYAYEFFLDPSRLRLNVPTCFARLAAATVPQPDLIICLSANPKQVVARKSELSEREIEQYHNRLQEMASGNQRCVILDASGNLAEVLDKARRALVVGLFKHC